MADDLLDMAVRQLGSSGIGALGSALGLPEGKGESAVNTGLSTVLAGMLHKGNSKTGMASLFNMVTGSSGLDFSNIADVFEDQEQMSSLQKSGGNMLETIFGDKSGDVGSTLSGSLGLSGGTGGSLLKVAAPVVMSLLGKLVKSKGLDISGLGSLLLGQKSHIKGHLPDGLLKQLGVSDFGKLGEGLETHGHEEPQEARPEAVQHKREKKRGSFGKWFWPLLIALAALYALNMCAKKDEVEDQPGQVILEEETTMTETPDGTMGDTADFSTSFREYIDSASRDPNREFPLTIEFDKGSAEVTGASTPDVEALATILQENEGLTVAVEGHTSGEGDEARNQQLSQERANVVRQMLVNKGIDGSRITATGMGSAKQVADDSTEEGREKNRRISVRVVNFE
ncbi:OmpA family protein [Microbulbifer halophilus]|uniref:OmpA family protein n=1 Tax=Microbulbifer halophilus TaxID=453963 RepID=A0ABW5E8T9_9GAMM|nr:OmpA family protein [Microbulbifer halophilus]MCW8126738.1 OmpA family protein [Microbulbifer halophilus]